MSNPIKISNDELAEVKMLQNKISQKIFEFGNHGIEKVDLDRRVQDYVERDKKLREEWEGLRRLEQEFVNKLIKKYGEGDLDLKEGTFSPNSTPPAS
jgi:ribosomal 50S subunit-associated protein YjgA (DUF615 family)